MAKLLLPRELRHAAASLSLLVLAFASAPHASADVVYEWEGVCDDSWPNTACRDSEETVKATLTLRAGYTPGDQLVADDFVSLVINWDRYTGGAITERPDEITGALPNVDIGDAESAAIFLEVADVTMDTDTGGTGTGRGWSMEFGGNNWYGTEDPSLWRLVSTGDPVVSVPEPGSLSLLLMGGLGLLIGARRRRRS